MLLYPGVDHKICIVGTGYVGMASAIGFAELGHGVTGFDIVPERVSALQQGLTPYREAGIEDLLRRHLDSGGIRFTNHLSAAVAESDFVVIAVGTPALEDGSADLSAVESAMAAVTPFLASDAIVVLRSTVPPCTTDRLARESTAPLVYAPEFLREGSAVADFLNPDRIVIGAESPEFARRYADLLKRLDRPSIVTTYRNAELIKGFSNAFLALKISFANEVANLCDLLDADSPAVLSGVGHDRRIGTAFLEPGIGFGGPCFEKDIKSLHHIAGEHGTGRELLAATLRVNAEQPKRIVDMLQSELGDLRDKRIGVWGLAFKAGTDDVRDSLAIRIVDDLLSRGADALAYDPAVRIPQPAVRCQLAPSALAAIDGANALLVLTEWPEFRDVAPWAIASRLRSGIVVDGRNILDPNAVTAAGMRYRGVGRKAACTTDATTQLAAVS